MGLLSWLLGRDRPPAIGRADWDAARKAGYPVGPEHWCPLPLQGTTFVCPECGCPWRYTWNVVGLETVYTLEAADPHDHRKGAKTVPVGSRSERDYYWVCDAAP
jgi:hypothetical protein